MSDDVPRQDAVEPSGTIEIAVVMRLVRGLLEWPYPLICRHLVAHDLLDAMEDAGVEMPPGLLRAVTRADDEAAIEILGDFGSGGAVRPNP